MNWLPGDRIWYEPSPGLRFAGVIVGEGTLPETVRAKLVGHYAQWKSRDGQHAPFESRIVPAVALSAIVRRSEGLGSYEP